MSALRRTRRFAIGFFLLYAIAVIYPGVGFFRGPRPFIFGMPLAMVWTAAWVVVAFFVLLRLDRAYSAAERAHDTGWRGNRSADDGRSDTRLSREPQPPTES